MKKERGSEMKNYIEMRGIQKPVVTWMVDGVECRCIDFYPVKFKGIWVVEIEPTMINGKKAQYVNIETRPELAAKLREAEAEYERRFLARYPGIDELLSARNASETYHESFQRMMEDEMNDGINPPDQPALSAAEAAKKYPIAAAYLSLLRLADSDPGSQIGYERRKAGKAAFDKILAGADVIEAEKEAQQRLNGVKLLSD